jgi:hypothetical protein
LTTPKPPCTFEKFAKDPRTTRCAGTKIQGAKNPRTNDLFFYSGESRRNRNTMIAIVIDDDVDQPITTEAERATSRTDHETPPA